MDLDVRSELPDAMPGLPAERLAAAWGDRNLQRLEGVGGFVRCLMPVRLTGGGSVTYSVWLKVDDDQLRHANQVWTTDEYVDLTLRGEVANAIRPWPDLLGGAAEARTRDVGTLPYLSPVGEGVLSQVLTQVWDRDDVLSRIGHALPVAVQQQVTASWSIERTAGLAPRVHGDIMRFVGPGRTVHFEAFGLPDGMTPEVVLTKMTEGTPQPRDGELSEQDGDLLRHAFWLKATPNGRTQYELYGHAAAPAGGAYITCMYDSADDLEWALAVWRSARPTSTTSGELSQQL
ncbi:DUF2199 domain-containing protein [Actinoplanes sp. TRM 88003]|uniref:DUF2199 domain-containing protein n=1 Tax=Paractinoplanes aksuensis TaxID=2939490 RepID=A0ABT1DU82_9ACTN|nr:DUF2199 domain-containing protein [Actinoplanes aksuensis]